MSGELVQVPVPGADALMALHEDGTVWVALKPMCDTLNWSEDARKRAWLIATSCIKTKGHYRDIYDATRAKYAEAVHNADCVRCGPAGKPALAGSPLSLGHQHARGLRAIAKELLRDLWIESKRIHELQAQGGQVAA